MIEGLRRNGVAVVECHVPFWHGVDDRVRVASGGWGRPSFLIRVLDTYARLLRVYRDVGEYDVMILGYPGQLDVPLAWLLTRLRGKPLVLDVFMSIHLIARERGLTARHRFTARLVYLLEKLACRLPDRLIIDTAEYVKWFQEEYDLDPARFRLVPTGADDRLFRPLEADRHADGLFRVLYYGTFIPNHGVEYIIEAARILEDSQEIHFELIGDGPTKARAMALAQEYGLKNVTFVDWVDKEALPHKAVEADICLGVFGTTPQSMMTVQNKIYQALAMAKPVITGDSATVRSHLRHRRDVYLVQRENPQALAEAILDLQGNPSLRNRLASHGHQLFVTRFSVARIGARARRHLDELVSTSRGSQ